MQRRNVVVRTLDYIDAERRTVATNRQWENPAARRNRTRLLDRIRGWYHTELRKIDTVLDRLNHPPNCIEK
jgi:hypothetical protein